MRRKAIKPGSPQDWLQHAKSDLALARVRKARDVLYSHLCFHAQQSAEKAVKAVLVAHRVCFPRTHDLANLLLCYAISLPSVASLFWKEALPQKAHNSQEDLI